MTGQGETPVPVAIGVNEKAEPVQPTQKRSRASTQKQKRPEISRKNPAKPEVESFAGDDFAVDDLLDDNYSADDFAGDVDSEVWRIETRTYTKQDGTIMLYFNHRRRTYAVKDNGKKYYPYKKGGKRVIGHE